MSKWTYFAVFSSIQGLIHKIQALLLQIPGVFKAKIIFKQFLRSIPGPCESWGKRPKSASAKSSSCRFFFLAARNANTKATEYVTFGFFFVYWLFPPLGKFELGFYTSCSDISQKLPEKFSKVAQNHFTKKLLKSCFLSTQKNQFLLLMKVNLCTSIRIFTYLYINFYSLTFLYLQRWYFSLSTCVSYSTSVYGSLF